MVEQLVGGEDAVRVQGHAGGDAVQPAAGEGVAVGAEPRRELVRQPTGRSVVHAARVGFLGPVPPERVAAARGRRRGL